MKTINSIFLVLLLFSVGCKSKFASVIIEDFKPSCLVLQLSADYEEYVFYNWYKVNPAACEVNSFSLKNDFGYKRGYFKNGVQNGKWTSNRYYYLDSLGHKILKSYIFREEFFKNGLRDSIYKIYNKEGNVIYSTYFENGTGLEKDFHENGKLYYEIATQNGYFTDTIKLYDNRGKQVENLLYKKDSLAYHYESRGGFLDTIENGRKARFIYSTDNKLNPEIGQKIFKNEIWKYKTGKVLKKIKDTIKNGVEIIIEENIDGDEVVRTSFKKNNSKIEYESIYHYSKGKLKSKNIVETIKNKNPIETKTLYNEKGEIISICKREFSSKNALRSNQSGEITDYYKEGEKYQWSKLICIESKRNSDIGELGLVKLEELNYYNLKNELIKIEYLKDVSYLCQDFHDSQNPKIIQKIELIKTEWYKNGKLVRTQINKTP
jgi:antitoxin component YwqK of YwqJK toxin-antitoxin module